MITVTSLFFNDSYLHCQHNFTTQMAVHQAGVGRVSHLEVERLLNDRQELC